MTQEELSYPLGVCLDYRVHPGWHRPYLDGLLKGEAIAACCGGCGRTTFPPNRTCRCGARAVIWTKLSGRGTIVAMTRGRGVLPLGETVRDRIFALIAMDGADNSAFGRLDGTPEVIPADTRVSLVTASEPAGFPTQTACFAVVAPAPATESPHGY